MNQPNQMQQSITSLLFVVYIQLNVFRASLCPSSGAYQLQQQPLVYRRNVVVAVLLAVVGPDRPQPTALLPPRSNGKPDAATAVDKLLMICMRMPETCWAVFKRQAIKLRDRCILLVDLFEYMMMHELTNPKCCILLCLLGVLCVISGVGQWDSNM